MWPIWVAFGLGLMLVRGADRVTLGMIVAGLFAAQVPMATLHPVAARAAVAAIWLAVAGAAFARMGDKSSSGGKFMVVICLALIVPSMWLGRGFELVGWSIGPSNPGVILSHVFGTLAMLEAGCGISERLFGSTGSGRLDCGSERGGGFAGRCVVHMAAGEAQEVAAMRTDGSGRDGR